jgi:hypothetical protein
MHNQQITQEFDNQHLHSLSAHYKLINTNTQEHLDVHHLATTAWPCGASTIALARPALPILLLEFKVFKE